MKKKKTGRPKIIFTEDQWEQFEKLCGLHATKMEICSWFKIQDDTLDRLIKERYGKSFSEIYQEKKMLGTIALRRAGFKLAQENPAVHIFYAKNLLNMHDEYLHDLKFDIVIGKDAKNTHSES